MTIRHTLNSQADRRSGELFTLPSMTIPDQTLSVRELYERYARGLPLDGGRIAVYDPDDDLPDPRTLDLAERQELKEAYEAELRGMEERVRQSRKPKQPKQAASDSEPAAKTQQGPAGLGNEPATPSNPGASR